MNNLCNIFRYCQEIVIFRFSPFFKILNIFFKAFLILGYLFSFIFGFEFPLLNIFWWFKKRFLFRIIVVLQLNQLSWLNRINIFFAFLVSLAFQIALEFVSFFSAYWMCTSILYCIVQKCKNERLIVKFRCKGLGFEWKTCKACKFKICKI